MLREIGDSSSMLHECVLANFPGILTDAALESLQQLSGSRVKFEDLLYLLQSAWQEAGALRVCSWRPFLHVATW